MNTEKISTSIVCQDILDNLKRRKELLEQLKPIRNKVRDITIELRHLNDNFEKIDKEKYINLFEKYYIKIPGYRSFEGTLYELKSISEKKFEFQETDEFTGNSILNKYTDYLVEYNEILLHKGSLHKSKNNRKCSLRDFLRILDFDEAYLLERRIKNNDWY